MYHFNPHFPNKNWGLQSLNNLTKSIQLTSDKTWALKYHHVALDNTVKETPGLLGETANSRVGVRDVEDKTRTFYCT